MSLFILHQGFQVVATETGGKVVHLRTGDELHLSATEVQVLARATIVGINTADEALKPLIKKFASLKILVPSARPPTLVADPQPAAPSEPVARVKPVATDPVPLFKADLDVKRR